MIEDYRGLAVFVAVADAGSLSAAGRRLNLSTSVVSHHLSRLEAKMGTALFFRSTRSMSLTAEGHAALAPARRMVAAGEEALDALSAGSDEPVGALHITMPAWGERTRLRQKIWDFARLYPMVAISLQSSDVQSDLVKEGFDLAIRLGKLADSGLKSRRIADFKRVLVASPDYLASRQTVKTFEDLAACDFIAITCFPMQRPSSGTAGLSCSSRRMCAWRWTPSDRQNPRSLPASVYGTSLLAKSMKRSLRAGLSRSCRNGACPILAFTPFGQKPAPRRP